MTPASQASVKLVLEGRRLGFATVTKKKNYTVRTNQSLLALLDGSRDQVVDRTNQNMYISRTDSTDPDFLPTYLFPALLGIPLFLEHFLFLSQQQIY